MTYLPIHPSQGEILKIVLNSKPLFLFEQNEIKIASRQWNGIHADPVMSVPVFQRTAATFFQPSLAWLARSCDFDVRSIFIPRHLAMHLRPRLTSEILHCKRNIYVAAITVTVKCELSISIHSGWPEWLTLLTNGH